MIKWTDEEIYILWESYPKATPDELKELFPNRTINSIRSKARQLNVKKEKVVQRRNMSLGGKKENETSYTQDELEVMKSVYPKSGVSGVRKVLPHRSIKSIKQKAHTMGLKIDDPKWKKDAEIVVKNDIHRITKIIYKKEN